MANSILLSKKHALWVFLYSLVFLGTTIPNIALICIVAVIPFTGGAWIGGMAAVSYFETDAAYLPAAWLAVFTQAYFVFLVAKLFKTLKKGKATDVTDA